MEEVIALSSISTIKVVHMSMSKLTNSFRKTKSSKKLRGSKSLLDVGDMAPDFELRDEKGVVHKLSSFRGRRVMLSFYRFAS